MITAVGERRAPALLEIEGLRVRHGERTLVERVDLRVGRGESVGIVGESGSGKSLTARAALGVLPAGLTATGSIRLDGRELLGLSERRLTAIRGSEIGLVMQDPFTLLNPLMTCGRQLTDGLPVAGRGRRARAARRDEAVRRLEEVGIDDPAVADRYPFQLSGGMRQRVGIAAALSRDPRVLIADEPSTALDVTTQSEILALISSLQASRGMAVVLITHDLRVAFSVCERICVLYAGSQLELGPADEVAAAPEHPYTHGLLLSEPPLDVRLARLPALPGSVPEPDAVAGRCAFADRCAHAGPVCTAARPPLAATSPGRATACVRIDDLRGALVVGDDAHEPAEARPVAGTAAPVLQAAGVVRTFAGRGGAVHALKGVSIEVAAGEAVGIVGESGSGKTTLGRCLVGLERADGGRVLVAGEDATDRRALAAVRRRDLCHRVQMVFQDPYSSLNPRLSVGATIQEAIDVAGRSPHGVEDLLGRVGLPAAYARRRPVALSGGERQRVALARALAAVPDVLVCDEAVSALDLSVQAQILNLLNDLRAELGLAIVFITHDLSVVRQVAERVYVMHRGTVVEAGPIDHVLAHSTHPYTQQLVGSVLRVPATPAAADPDAVPRP